jgi:outer membrane lipoprotein-sorting protein
MSRTDSMAGSTPSARRLRLRWIAPVAAAALAIGGGFAANTASAEPNLPKKTAEQLLTDVASAQINGLSGTVSQTAALGLPSLPSGGGPHSGSDFSDLLSGTHTLRVWAAGENKSRIDKLGTYGESSLIRNGDQAWLWSSEQKSALHTTYVGDHDRDHRKDAGDIPATPQQAAEEALQAIDPSTETEVARNVTVAGRPAYELVLTPKDERSLVAEVAIAVDAETSAPLRVQAYADGAKNPAYSVGFTKIDFSVPDSDTFTFDPPAGTKVTEKTIGDEKTDRAEADHEEPTIVGEGWTTVVVAELDAPKPDDQGNDQGNDREGREQNPLQALPRVSGSWGSGRLLSSALFSAVITDDGRVAAGAVRPGLLYDALDR